MNARERFLAVMNFEPVQTLRWEFGYWAGTLHRWYGEGLPKKSGLDDKWNYGDGIHGGAAGWRPGRPLASDVNDLVGLDEGLQRTLFNNYLCPKFEEVILEDHEKWVLLKNDMGIIEKRLKQHGSLPAYLDGPVKDRDDWERLKAERLRPNLEGRLPDDWEAIKKVYKTRTFPLAIGGGQGFYGTPRYLLGESQVLTASYHSPDLLRQIVNDLADFWIALYDQILDQIDVDLALLWEDICYKSGPLIAPKTFREFILPGYVKLTNFLRDRGIRHVIIDTDGNIWKLLPLFLEGGVTGIYPFEVAAGMNVIEVRKTYPRLEMLGGISKAALIDGKDSIDVELETKIPWMLTQGGYIPYMDHLVPPDVSWQNFQYYRTKLNQYIGDSYPH